MSITAQDVFEYHGRGRPGKIEVVPSKPLNTQRDLSLAYTPGVAKVVEEIERRPEAAYEYTAKANLVAYSATDWPATRVVLAPSSSASRSARATWSRSSSLRLACRAVST